jgi:hypothetical protein
MHLHHHQTTVAAQTNDAAVQSRSLEIATAALAAAATQRLQSTKSSKDTRPMTPLTNTDSDHSFNSFGDDSSPSEPVNGKDQPSCYSSSVVLKKVQEDPSRSSLQIMQESTNPYGYGDQDAASKNKQQQANPYGYEDMNVDNSRQATAATSTNPYGYEDRDAAPQCKEQSNPYGYGDTQQSNPYGYGDTQQSNPYGYGDTQQSNPYGYGDSDAQPPPRARRHPRPNRRGSVTKFSLQPQTKVVSSEAQTPIVQNTLIKSIPMDTMQPEVPQALAAPDLKQLSAGLQTPAWQPQRCPPFALPKNGILASNRSGSLLNIQEVPLKGTDSILSNLGKNTLSDSQSSLDLEGSFSNLPQVHRTPSRSDSGRSFTGKRSDSMLSFASDVESLAPDLESLCSISRHADSLDVPPPPPLSIFAARGFTSPKTDRPRLERPPLASPLAMGSPRLLSRSLSGGNKRTVNMKLSPTSSNNRKVPFRPIPCLSDQLQDQQPASFPSHTNNACTESYQRKYASH